MNQTVMVHQKNQGVDTDGINGKSRFNPKPVNKNQEHQLRDIMPPIISIKSKMVTPSKIRPLKVSYEGIDAYDQVRKTNTSMQIDVLRNL